MLRWGILGAGGIAQKFAGDMMLVENSEIIAVASRSIEKANEFADKYTIAHRYGSYEEMVLDPNVDIVYIATPHSHHYEHTRLCLENNKSVLCEKAFAVNSTQAKEMIRLAKEKKLFLMEALWTKFLPHYRKLQQLLAEDITGGIHSVLINFGFRPKQPVPQRLFDPELAGGTMLDIGIYNVFMAMSVLGRPDAIEAHMTPASTGVDAQCAVLFKYNTGAIAQLFSSFTTHLPTEAEISGPKGRIKLTHRFYAHEASIEFYPEKPDSRQVIAIEKDAEGFGYQYETRHVAECMAKGLLESPVMTHADTIELMEVLDEIRSKAGIRYAADELSSATE